jgi:F420H(2)-dependent quinone reductase
VDRKYRYTVAFDRKIGPHFYRLHCRVYQLTGGLVGHRSMMGPMLLLTTTGRKSGQARTTPLLYMPDGDQYFVVGSNGGRDRPPAWLLNLEATPKVRIQVGRRGTAAVAEVLGEEERAAIWPRLVAHYPGWDQYGQLTDRQLRAVRLRPVA